MKDFGRQAIIFSLNLYSIASTRFSIIINEKRHTCDTQVNRKTLQVVGLGVATAPNNKTRKAQQKAAAKSLCYLQMRENQKVTITNAD